MKIPLSILYLDIDKVWDVTVPVKFIPDDDFQVEEENWNTGEMDPCWKFLLMKMHIHMTALKKSGTNL